MKRPALKLAMSMLLVAAAASCGGCTQLIAWMAAQFTPPKKIKPLFEFPKDKKILVLVEDRPFPSPYHVKYQLTERVNQKLREQKILREPIPYDRVQDLATARDFQQLAISQVGQKLGADLVLYVQVEDYALKDNPYSPLWHARLETSVWVVDVQTGEKLWPKTSTKNSGHRVKPSEYSHTEDPSITGDLVVNTLSEETADRIAKLFYEHEEAADPDHDEGPRQPED